MKRLIDCLPCNLAWTVHNLVGHPLSEVIYLITLGKGVYVVNWIHDVTVPTHDKDQEGRG